MHDAIVVGAGFMGLAMAHELTRAGQTVLVLDRSGRARSPTDEGASMRAYGNVLVLGHPRGLRTRWALRAREKWLDLLAAERAWHRAGGILLIARRDEEVRVLEEVREEHIDPAVEARLLAPAEVARLVPSTSGRPARLGLFSPQDLLVDPRALVPAWRSSLAARPGATVAMDCPALAIDGTAVRTPRGVFEARHVYVCTGYDVAELFGDLDLTAVKLQMLACHPLPASQRFTPVVAGGLTMSHMAGFAGCAGMSALRDQLREAHPGCARHGIHVMGAVSPDGSVLVGDSHEVGADLQLADKAEIDRCMASYLEELVGIGPLRPSHRWQAVYYRHRDRPWLIRSLSPGVTAVLALGGTGLTYSLALAEHIARHGAACPIERELSWHQVQEESEPGGRALDDRIPVSPGASSTP